MEDAGEVRVVVEHGGLEEVRLLQAEVGDARSQEMPETQSDFPCEASRKKEASRSLEF